MSVNAPMAVPFYARDIEEAFDWMSILFYGDYGVGKTWLAGSAVFEENMRDILYVALEGGEKGLKEVVKLCRQKGIDPNKHVMVIQVQNYKQYAYIYEFMKLHIACRDKNDLAGLRKLEGQIKGIPIDVLNDPEKMEQLIPQPKLIRTVITDSLTEAQKYCMYQILGINPLTQRLDAEPDAAQFQD